MEKIGGGSNSIIWIGKFKKIKNSNQVYALKIVSKMNMVKNPNSND
jgi:hypothetical protein